MLDKLEKLEEEIEKVLELHKTDKPSDYSHVYDMHMIEVGSLKIVLNWVLAKIKELKEKEDESYNNKNTRTRAR